MVLFMSSSVFFPFSPQWVFSVPPGASSWSFVVCFPGLAPEGFVAWVRSSSVVQVARVYPAPSWRGFGAGVAVRLVVRDPSIAEAIKRAAPKGGGGSLHPACAMLF